MHSHHLKRGAALLMGVSLLLLALLSPDHWYASPPTDSLPGGVPPGLLLWRAILAVVGILLAYGAVAFRYQQIPQAARLLRAHPTPSEARDITRQATFWGMIAVTLLAAGLRLHHFNSELWIDEIAHRLTFRDATVWQIFTTYTTANNHLLNSLLCKLLVDLLGEGEVAVRFPAILFGILTIPATYWFFRLCLLRWESLGAALLLALSYHHIFFSQNSRGYGALILFGLLATGAFIRALQTDQPRYWALYLAAAALGMASNIVCIFVLATHGLIAAVLLIQLPRKFPILKRLVGVYGVMGVLVLAIYAPILPTMFKYYGSYDTIRGAYNPFSWRFVEEILRGFSAQFLSNILVAGVIFALVGAVGFYGVVRRSAIVVVALLLPHVLLLLFSSIDRLPVYPRLFLSALILMIMVLIELISMIVSRFAPIKAKLRLQLAALALIALVSIWPLLRYYSTPKQPYRTALEYLESFRTPDNMVIMVDLASAGYEYYGPLLGLSEDIYFTARSPERFDELLTVAGSRRVILVTSLEPESRMFDQEKPRIEDGWERVHTFPALVHDAEVSIWLPLTP